MEALQPPRFNVLGVGVSVLTLERARDLLLQARGRRRLGYVCATGVHGVMESQDDPELKRIHNRAWAVAPDGMPLVWLGPRGVGRVYGPDLMLAVCDAGREIGLRHYFYGGAESVAVDLGRKLSARFPGLQVAGAFTPPFRPLTDAEFSVLQADVARTQPDVMWIGLGTPKQERFMARYAGSLDAGVLVGVGAAFDFHTGRLRQAPRWMQRSGLVWLFRLAIEPRRLGPRYLRNNPRFLLMLLLSACGMRRFPLKLPDTQR